MLVGKNLSELKDLVADLQLVDIISLDTEASGLDPYTSDLLLIQIEANKNIYVLDVPEFRKQELRYIVDLISARKIEVVGHNLKFDLKMIFHNTGILITNVFDTMIAEGLITAGVGKYLYSLGDLVSTHCGTTLDKETREDFIDATIVTQEMLIYAANDVKYLLEIRDKQKKQITDLSLDKVAKIEMKMVPVISRMEYDGILIDVENWRKLEEENRKKSIEYDSKIKPGIWDAIKKIKFTNALDLVEQVAITEVNGGKVTAKFRQEMLKEITDQEAIKDIFLSNFNTGSPAQLKLALNRSGIPTSSTAEKELKRYSGNEIIDNILKYKEYAKLVSTYGETFIGKVNPITNRTHTDYNQIGTATGRFSSSDPNLQNIPKSNAFRHLFIARPGYKLITCDYSQQELRLLGTLSREPKFIEAYVEGQDLHALTASIIFEVPIDQVTKDQRYIGKTMNFAVVYGTTAWGLQYNFDIPLKEGEQYLNQYFKGYKILGGFIEAAGNKVLELKYSKTPLGRIRFFEDKKLFEDWKEKERYEQRIKREGVNHIIQGGSADMIKIAMNYIFYNNPFPDNDFRILMQVHDEVVVEAKEEIVEEAKDFIVTSMEKIEQPFLGEIPAKADPIVENYWSKD